MMSRPERRGMPTGERARVIPGRDFENIFFQTSSSFGIFQIDGCCVKGQALQSPPGQRQQSNCLQGSSLQMKHFIPLPPCLQSASMYNTIQSYHQEDNLVLCTPRTRSCYRTNRKSPICIPAIP